MAFGASRSHAVLLALADCGPSTADSFASDTSGNAGDVSSSTSSLATIGSDATTETDATSLDVNATTMESATTGSPDACADFKGVVTPEQVELTPQEPSLSGCAEGTTWHYWWTDAHAGQIDFPITAGVHLTSEPGREPTVVCSWSDGEEPCPQPACL